MSKRARHNLSRFLRRSVGPLFFFGGVALPIALLSSLATYYANYRNTLPLSVYVICSSATFVGLIVFWLLLRWSENGFIKKHCFPFYEANSRSKVLIGIILASVIASITLLVTYALPHQNMFENLGSLFTLVAGIGTFAGVFLTLESVMDFRMIITSFSELINRVCNLIETTRRNDYVRFLAWTPALGCLSLPEYEWEKLNGLLDAHPLRRIQVTCLEKNDLQLWHNLFVGRVTEGSSLPLKPDKIKNASTASERIIERYSEASRTDPAIEPKRKRMGGLPGYYLFANNDRAIMVAPFFIQLPLGTPEEIQKRSLPSVQMLGFETSEPTIVKMVHRIINTYREEVPEESPFFRDGVGDLKKVQALLRANIKELPDSKLLDVSTIRYRLSAFKEVSPDGD